MFPHSGIAVYLLTNKVHIYYELKVVVGKTGGIIVSKNKKSSRRKKKYLLTIIILII